MCYPRVGKLCFGCVSSRSVLGSFVAVHVFADVKVEVANSLTSSTAPDRATHSSIV